MKISLVCALLLFNPVEILTLILTRYPSCACLLVLRVLSVVKELSRPKSKVQMKVGLGETHSNLGNWKSSSPLQPMLCETPVLLGHFFVEVLTCSLFLYNCHFCRAVGESAMVYLRGKRGAYVECSHKLCGN